MIAGKIISPVWEVGAMRSTPKLLAAITASGAVLYLNVPAQGHRANNQDKLTIESESQRLSERVEQLQEKLRSSFAAFSEPSAEGRIDNIVQFFNCLRPGFRNC